MTLEGQGPGEDQTVAPPARTRWSEDAHDDADVLLPPYVPGRAAPKPDAPAGQEAPGSPADEAPAAPSAEEAESPGSWSETESPDSWSEPAESGNFVAPEPEAVSGTVEPERSASVEPEAGSSEGTSGDYPWDAAGPDEGFGPETASGAVTGPESEERAEPWVAYGPGGEDEFPFGAFDIEGPGEGAGAEEPTEADSAAAAAAAASGSGSLPGPAEMAERLERLAEALRREGRPGVEREMGSEDRLTSLVAGVLAGYLAGRNG